MEITELLKTKGDYIFDVNEWGSCQYSGALAMYKAYFKLREKYERDTILAYLKYEFNYQITFDSIEDDTTAINNFFLSYGKCRGWKFTDLYDDDEIESLDKYDSKLLYSIRLAKSADDLFFVGRNASSDLWDTAPRVCESYFKNFKAENLPDCDNPIGLEKGPVGNICVQSTNVFVGLCCALLVDYELVKNENSFKGFDT